MSKFGSLSVRSSNKRLKDKFRWLESYIMAAVGIRHFADCHDSQEDPDGENSAHTGSTRNQFHGSPTFKVE